MGDMKFKVLKKKKIVIIGAVVLVLAAGVVYGKSKGSKTEDVGAFITTSVVEKKDIKNTLSLKAPLEGTESAEIVSQLHYEVIQLNVKEGDRVKKGQVLAVLDSESLKKDIQKAEDNLQLLILQNQESSRDEQQSAEQARLNLEESLEDKQREYEKAVAELETDQRNYNSIKELAQIGAKSQEDLKQAKKDYQDAQRVVDGYDVKDGKVVASDAELKSLEKATTTNSASRTKQIAIERKDIERKKQDLEDCEIKSPIDGTITRVNIKRGRFADETDDDKPMFVVENIDNLQMKVMVSEYDIDKVKIGQTAEISADILGDETVQGVVTRISPTGEEKSGTAERVIPAVVEVQGKEHGLIAGINAKASILVDESKNAFVLPIECLTKNPEGETQVLRVDKENKIHVVTVKTGVENDLEVEIISDELKDGDTVVLSPTPDLTEGSVVATSQV